ncbi:bifunctional oligoribonuclease/PAP phosphatase NrnA [Lagierella sp.]|uniref:DHH family phosphoesterase n=1 Tax=Lagierella sp. TaxID=2849657 RepID=UPI00262D758D|nr:bifunctional oligoribonuclease/PAP phosphatase NrnA [Lagierella sp.]
MSKIEELREIIAKNKSFAVISHLRPDGDNLGSIIAMSRLLENLGKIVYPIQLDLMPDKFNFITNNINFYSDIIFEVDVVIALDCADKKRLGEVDSLLNSAKDIIKIDHHNTIENYGTLNIVDKDISSTCELLTKIFINLNIEFTPQISTALLTGILTDTGRFLYDSADEETLNISSFLINNGADKKLLMDKLFQSESLNSKKAQLEILKNAHFYYDSNLVILRQTKSILDSYSVSDSDVENAINYYRESKEVKAVVMIKEITETSYKVSFRSKSGVDVCQIATEFGGGGHIQASGCKIEGPIDVVESKIVERFDIFE